MDAQRGGVRQVVVAFVLITSAMSIALACATSPTGESAPGFVRDVLVDQDDSGTVVTLIGLVEASHSSFSTSDPHTVVIDLVDVWLDGGATRIPVYDGMVNQVSLSSFSPVSGESGEFNESGELLESVESVGSATRVEITTSREADFEISQSPLGLVIRLSERGAQSEQSADEDLWADAFEEVDPWASPLLAAASPNPLLDSLEPTPLAETTTAALMDTGELEVSPPATQAQSPLKLPAPSQATELTGVEVEALEDGVLVHFRADGAIGVSERFALANPDRFVVDLPGLTTAISGLSFAVDSDRVTRVRVGAHPGKVRVVIDGGPQADGFAGRRILPSRDGLFVGLGDGPALAEAMSRGVAEADRLALLALSAALPPAILIPAEPSLEPSDLVTADEPIDPDSTDSSDSTYLTASPFQSPEPEASESAELELAQVSIEDSAQPEETTEQSAVEPVEAETLEVVDANAESWADADEGSDSLAADDTLIAAVDRLAAPGFGAGNTVEVEVDPPARQDLGAADGVSEVVDSTTLAEHEVPELPAADAIDSHELADASETSDAAESADVAEPFELVEAADTGGAGTNPWWKLGFGRNRSPSPGQDEPTRETASVDPIETTDFADFETGEMVETAEIADGQVLELADVVDASELEETSALAGASPEPGSETTALPAAIGESSPVRVYGINYTSRGSVDRIVVMSDRVAEYTIHTPDPETLVISLWDAVISPEVEGRISALPGAPISLITTFQQPEIDGNEVRLVVKRAPGLEPLVTPHGSMLFFDFPNDGEAAAPPPAFPLADAAPSELRDATPAAMTEEPLDEPEALPVAESEASASAEAEPQVVEVDPWANQPAEDRSAPADVSMAESSDQAESNQPPADAAPPAAVEILTEGGLVDGKEYRGRRISLDFNNVPVEDVLRLIAEVSDLNVIAGDAVKGNITIRMMDVPWDQALDIVLLTKGLGFIRIGNVLRIAPSAVLKAEAEVRLQERRNLEKLEDLIVKLLPVNYSDVRDASNMVKRLLSERGSVFEDERTSTLIIKDIPSVVDEAVALVTAIDTQTPQVLIEAKIVEANLDFSRELGIEWAISSQPLNNGFDSASGARSDLGGQDFRFYGDNSLSFSNPITSTPTASGVLSAFLLDEQLNLEVRIAAQESTGEGKVISSPRIVTMDNSEAIIEQGVSIPFQTFEQGDAKLEFIDAVLSLKVTPHITSDRSIIMKIEVTRNAPDGSVDTPTGSPAIAKNVAKTETLVGDGQTLVLGGIYTISKATTYSRVPYLHRIPIIGNAFQSKRIRDERKELLIFVTPRIMADVKTVVAY